MLKKMPIRWRLTSMTIVLLTVCCVGLTFVLNFTAYRLVDQFDAIVLTPAQKGDELSGTVAPPSSFHEPEPAAPTISTQEAKRGFKWESILYMLFVVTGGGLFTYYVSGRVLKPLDTLNGQIKNRTVHNLSETIKVPKANDEIAELTQSFNEMTEKLNTAFLMQSRFSANAAHELRTPLAVLKTKVDVFKKKSIHTSDEYNAMIAVFEKQTERLSGLVRNLLDLTNRDDVFEYESVYLKDVLEDIISELTPIAKEKDVFIKLICNDSVVYGNTDLLYRAFYNLIENGIKYNVKGGSVTVMVSCGKSETVIQIKDTGIGIPDQMKQNIFEPFYRVDESRSREMGGVGLGLSIVESILHKHHGKITVTDNEGGGSCFQIILNQ